MSKPTIGERAKDILAVLDEKILGLEMEDYPRTVEISLHLVGGIREIIQSYIALISRPVPTVTEEWVEEKTKYIAEHPSYHRLEVVLREAGVEIKKGCDKSSALMDKCKGFDTKKEGT